MGIKKFDFVDLLVQFFSILLGVLVALLFVPGMMPVHAEETIYTAPDGSTGFTLNNGTYLPYKFHYEYSYIEHTSGYTKQIDWYSPYEVVAYPGGTGSLGAPTYTLIACLYDGSISPPQQSYIVEKYYAGSTYKAESTTDRLSTVYYTWVEEVGSTVPFKIFDSEEHARAYLSTGNESGWINPPPIDLEANGSLDENIPIPHITLHSHNQVDVSISSSVSKYCHYVDNAAENYYIEVKGKWNSASDIELYRENLMWKSRVDSVVSGELSTWIPANDKFQSDRHFDFSDIECAVTAKNKLFADYPIDTRNIYGGNNSIGDALTGKNAFIQDIKDFAIYTKPYTSPEFYVRFWYKDDNGYHYSKWTHFYEGFGSEFNQEEVPLQSDKGLTDDELVNVEDGYSHSDPDLIPYDPGSGLNASMDSALSSFSDTLKKFGDVSSGVTGMFVSIFSFLPWWSTAILGFAIVAVVILRFVGR